jgi:hypothetical protein
LARAIATEALTARGQEFNIAAVVDEEDPGSSDEAPKKQIIKRCGGRDTIDVSKKIENAKEDMNELFAGRTSSLDNWR